MIRIICDKCGQMVRTKTLEALTTKKTLIGGYEYDLCPKCKEEVRRFIEQTEPQTDCAWK